MKLFLDSANLKEISTAARWGIVDGVTTNPSLLAKENTSSHETFKQICALINGPISVEVIDISSAETIISEAKKLSALHPNIVVKIPCTIEGIMAVRELETQGIQTNVTLVFSANQVLLAAKAQASFISPFVGRLDDAGENGLKMVSKSLDILRAYNFRSQIIVASVRSPATVLQAARIGAHIATIPFKILEQLIKHSLTDAGIRKFEEDWARIKTT